MSSLRRSRIAPTATAAIVGAAATLVVAAPAAAVPGLIVTIGWSSATASESFKWANAVCPHGTVILGGGADIIDGGHDVRLTSMVPAAPAGSTLTGVAATCPTGKKVIGTGAAAARSTRPAAKCLDTPLAAGGCGIRPERA